jgi:PDZ domain
LNCTFKLTTAAALTCALLGCAHIEGTRDKSSTSQRLATLGSIDSIAILPIKDDAGLPGLASKIETALTSSVQAQFPRAQILDAQAVGAKLTEHATVATYGQWRAGYEFTGMIDPASFEPTASAIGTRYLLAVHAPHLTREKIRGSDTGYSGTVNDANNVWRTDLDVPADLIDTQSKQVIWKGNGHAEHIHSPHKSRDYFFVIVNDKNPNIPEYVDEMIASAAKGLARQIDGAAPTTIPVQAAAAPAVLSDAPSNSPTNVSPARIPAGGCPSLGADLTKLAVTGMGSMDGVTGAMISGVSPTGAAARGGIRKGDIVIRVGDAEINDPADVQDAICRSPAGTAIDVKLSRQAQPVWVSVRF